MGKPGFLSGVNTYQPRRFVGGFGYFGKGFVAPPPPPPKPVPAMFKEGQWSCDNTPKPPSSATHSAFCCPSGWVMVQHGDTTPCKGIDKEKMACGPLPPGADEKSLTCCEKLKQWTAAAPAGSPDPCIALAMASGKAVPGMVDTMLAPEIVVPQGPLVGPGMIIAGGLAIAVLIGLTIFLKFM